MLSFTKQLKNPDRKVGIDHILTQYDQYCEKYSAFSTTIENRLKEIFEQQHLKIHSITSRIKTRESLINKLSTADTLYNDLSEITDIAGIRIIICFEDELDCIASIIKDEFVVAKSVDKRKVLATDRFGYLSSHYIVTLKPTNPYADFFSRCAAEIQIRSILQHAWAEIEHNIGYKNKAKLPEEIRRRLYRLAGVLELADKEFSTIKLKLSNRQSQRFSSLLSRLNFMLRLHKLTALAKTIGSRRDSVV
jgi:ppGpp synthetase/RelA/SpoT-type nucleotidyltranferase